MKDWDVIILTEDRYFEPEIVTEYKQQVIKEDQFVIDALKAKGLRVQRLTWSDPNFDWSSTHIAIIRSTWDYFHRFDEFSKWLKYVQEQTIFVNSPKLIHWNIDKHYLLDLEKAGVNIPPTYIIEPISETSLQGVYDRCGWPEVVLKPCIAGTARHTYRVNQNNIAELEDTFQKLIQNEAMMLQEFQFNIQTSGEVSFMIFNGKFTHAVLKKAKGDDFRVQDSFGGTSTIYHPSEKEIRFAEHVMHKCPEVPMYGRVDVMMDNNNESCVAEIEIIEPELWFRLHPPAAGLLAEMVKTKYF